MNNEKEDLKELARDLKELSYDLNIIEYYKEKLYEVLEFIDDNCQFENNRIKTQNEELINIFNKRMKIFIYLIEKQYTKFSTQIDNIPGVSIESFNKAKEDLYDYVKTRHEKLSSIEYIVKAFKSLIKNKFYTYDPVYKIVHEPVSIDDLLKDN